MFPNRIHVLQSHPGYRVEKPYAIGMFRKDYTKLIKCIDPSRKIDIESRGQIDVTKNVNDGLSMYGAPKVSGKVLIDVYATVKCPLDINGKEVIYSEIDTSEFLMYPIGRNIGIMIVMDIDEHADNYIEFSGQLVEPFYDVKTFSKHGIMW